MNQRLVKANEERKGEHLEIALRGEIDFEGVSTGLERYRFEHCALPEIDLESVDPSTHLFGKYLSAPILISSMVGGIEAAGHINRNLAKAAQSLELAFAVGSQRCAIENPDTAETYRVREVAPEIPLFANLGAAQLNCGYGVEECRRAVEMIDADGLILHLNPLQEALQSGGNTDFSGLKWRIEQVCRELALPVIVKEVGCGISGRVARSLVESGVSAIDVAGAGGTSWSRVEGQRAGSEFLKNLAEAFGTWGIPTAECIVGARRAAPDVTLIASGGVRGGLDVAKSIALGADLAGMAAPLIRAADLSLEAVLELLRKIIQELRIAMFCAGCQGLQELRGAVLVKEKA